MMDNTQLINSHKKMNDEEQDRPVNSGVRAGLYIQMVEYIIWFCSIFIGMKSLQRLDPKIMGYYISGLITALALEVISSIIIFSSYSKWTTKQQTLKVIYCLLQLMVLAVFISNGRELKRDMILWKQRVQTGQNAPQQPGNPLQSNPLYPQNAQQGINAAPLGGHHPYQNNAGVGFGQPFAQQ